MSNHPPSSSLILCLPSSAIRTDQVFCLFGCFALNALWTESLAYFDTLPYIVLFLLLCSLFSIKVSLTSSWMKYSVLWFVADFYLFFYFLLHFQFHLLLWHCKYPCSGTNKGQQYLILLYFIFQTLNSLYFHLVFLLLDAQDQRLWQGPIIINTDTFTRSVQYMYLFWSDLCHSRNKGDKGLFNEEQECYMERWPSYRIIMWKIRKYSRELRGGLKLDMLWTLTVRSSWAETPRVAVQSIVFIVIMQKHFG